MSLWDAVASFVSDNTDIIGSLAKGAATVAAASISANANEKAAEEASRAAQAQADAIAAGNAQAQQRFDTIQEQTEPGVSLLRTTALTPPGNLTPDQEFQLNEARRTALTGLNASGLRGSGRATTAILRDVESGFRNTAIAENRRRQDAAGQALAGQNFQAQTAGANLDSQQGRDEGAAANQVGLINAGLTTANTQLTGQALADVGSIIADATKKRESRFEDRSGNDNESEGV